MCRRSWMYIAWPSIPSSVCWTPHLGGDRRRPISYPPHPQPGPLTAVKVMDKRARQQPRLECGPWPGAELQIQTLGEGFSWKRGQCALDSLGRLPGGGMSFGRPWPQLRGEELGGLSGKEDQGRHGLRSNSEHSWEVGQCS